MFKKKKTFGDRIKELFGLGSDTQAFQEEMEDLLLEADLGSRMTMDLMADLKQDAKTKGIRDPDTLVNLLATHLASRLRTIRLPAPDQGLACYLFLGVNGVGKTTSIAKLARRWQGEQPDRDLVLAAGDTFRAAACEQLVNHGQRLGLRTVSQGSGADPAAVIFDALESVRAKGGGTVLADTAGRLHNKSHLVKELEKVDKVVRQKIGSGGLYQKILVIDATTGQNGLQQAEVFHQAVGVDAVILSKYDSNARGGVVAGICRQVGLPIAFVGTGEHYEALEVFDPASFVSRILQREVPRG